MVKAGQEPWRKKTLSWKLIHDVVPSQARFIEDLSLLPQNHANPISGYTIRIRSRKLRTQPISLKTRFWLKTEVALQILVGRMMVTVTHID
jgi:hypothetical protein